MGKPTGFIDIERKQPEKRSIKDRVSDYNEFLIEMTDKELQDQGARCMECGVPFCHSSCPLGNIIPDLNDLVFKGFWKEAYEKLSETNDFPEFTGRICPALCEGSCVLGINKKPVSICLIELSIIEKAFKSGWVLPNPPKFRTGKKVAIVGSGPAGLSAASQLNRAGHTVTIIERTNNFGGLLTYGIPNFKLDKKIVQRRINILKEEGIIFKANVDVGVDYKPQEILNDFDAVCLTLGAKVPRELNIEGRDLNGIHFAMEFLPQQTKRLLGEDFRTEREITAKGKKVLVIGGGDTGSDCVGTSVRQGAESIANYELLPSPPEQRSFDNPWPEWPRIIRVSSSHNEAETNGKIREYCVLTKKFLGDDKGNLTGVKGVRVEWKKDDKGRYNMEEIPNSEFERNFDMALIAMGFLHPERGPMITELGIELDERGNVKVDNDNQTNVKGVFCAGDMERGQSLIVWALADGRKAARNIDKNLMGEKAI